VQFLLYFDYHLKKFDIPAIEFLEKLKNGYMIYLKDAKSNFSWQTPLLLKKLCFVE